MQSSDVTVPDVYKRQFGTLSKMSDDKGDGVKKRADYMSGLKTKLEPITTYKKDNTCLLYTSRCV